METFCKFFPKAGPDGKGRVATVRVSDKFSAKILRSEGWSPKADFDGNKRFADALSRTT